MKPDWSQPWIYLGSVLADLGRFKEALAKYETGLELEPDNALSLRLFAQTLIELQNDDNAERMLIRALDKEPGDSQTLATLANMYERQNRLDEAANMARQALDVNSDNTLAMKVTATLAHRAGNKNEALTQMSELANKAESWSEKESVLFELAQLHDKLGNVEEAYASFVEANRLHKKAAEGRHIDPQTYVDHVKREAEMLATAPPKHVPPSLQADPPDPIFLMGFPRSGTTLLDQVLDSHPDVTVMEERPPLGDVHKRLSELEARTGEPFRVLDEEQKQVARQFYFQRVGTFVGDISGKTFVDKHPLATANIRTIKLLFPQARILFALRHPCDVVLSCFMQRFKVNIAMSNFHTLEDAATLYRLVMGLWQSAYPFLELPVHFVRYEDLVKDFDTQVSQALTFLDLAWDDKVAAFHEHAQKRGVRTASLRQVTQPLYTSSLARWQRYNAYLAPHMETLAPFIEAFGYASDPA